MGELKDRLQTDLTESMKARDELRTATLRMVLTAIGTEEVAGRSARVLTGDEELKVLAREAKKRREAAEAFRSGGAEDRAARELAEEEVLSTYLPAQLSDAELAELVAAAVAESGAQGPQAMGAVMKVVNPRVAGRADGGRVAAAVRAALAG
ncbi:MAG: GatB/YqeY domain-containing protein [Frankiales bacterium]|nr:MAG: GatB/YqeY domain-containing protein [Frankiales bacterium]